MLNSLWKKGTDFLGSPTAIMAGAMSWVSDHNLVAAISNAGGFGVIACSSMPAELLRQEIDKTRELTNKPFGVNLIVMHPDLDELLDVCKEKNISHVVLAGGVPTKSHIEKIKSYGGKAISFAPALIIGKRLIKNGIDALVIEGNEAGGHIGPVSTSVLAQEILPELKDELPIFVAGGIARGDMIASFLEMGAAGVQLGTRFVCAHESIAHENFKRVFLKAQAREATISVQVDKDFPVIPVRSITNKAAEEFADAQRKAIARFRSNELTKEQAQLEIEHYWAGALRRAVIDGDIEKGSLMAGQSVGLVKKEQSSKEIIDELVDQANGYLSRKNN